MIVERLNCDIRWVCGHTYTISITPLERSGLRTLAEDDDAPWLYVQCLRYIDRATPAFSSFNHAVDADRHMLIDDHRPSIGTWAAAVG